MIKNDRTGYVKRADLGRGNATSVLRVKHQKSRGPERHFLDTASDIHSYVEFVHKGNRKPD
jgi:hypothetical protein